MRGSGATVTPLSASGINEIGSDGFTLLQSAVLRCDLKKAQSLVESGANSSNKGTHGRSPIFLVADNFGTGNGNDDDRLKILKFLLDNGANPSPLVREIGSEGHRQVARSDSLTHIAVVKEDPRLLMVLLQHNLETGVDRVGLDVVDEYGVSPIESGAEKGNSEAVNVVLNFRDRLGCRISQKSLDEALYYTCKVLTREKTNIFGKWRVVESLIKAGANPRICFEKPGLSAISILDKHHCERGEKIKKIISENEDRVTLISDAEEIKGDPRMKECATRPSESLSGAGVSASRFQGVGIGAGQLEEM